MLYHWEATSPNKVYLRQPYPSKGYTEITYQEAMSQIRKVAAALKAKGFPPGSHIALASKNCAHWMMADFAIWMAGYVSVPLYPNLTQSSIREILKHSECRLVFLGKLDDPKLYREAVPKDLPTIAFPYHEFSQAEKWEHLIANTPAMHANPNRAMSELATIIYTSGTTGEPKGVMHPFSSFANAANGILSVLDVNPSDRFFSYLPLAHVAERVLVETCSLYAGSSVSFAESLDTFQANLQSVKPTVFLSVPRLWQKFQGGILAKVPQKKLSLLLKLPVISGLIKKKIKTGLGLQEARYLVTGAAPTPPSLLEWFRKIDLNIGEAYGMTENFAYSHFNRPGKEKIGTVGESWPLVQTRIAEDGEIQIQTPCDFRGYYKSQSKRTEFFDGGYFKTGDRGEIDSEGYLKITGRTKDLFKTSKGKYVAPSPIESKIATCSHLEAVCVVGANLSQPLALAVLSQSAQNTEPSVVKSELEQCLDEVNAALDPHEKVARIILVRDPWTVESGAITPSMKVKRNEIEARYGQFFDKWASETEKVSWES